MRSITIVAAAAVAAGAMPASAATIVQTYSSGRLGAAYIPPVIPTGDVLAQVTAQISYALDYSIRFVAAGTEPLVIGLRLDAPTFSPFGDLGTVSAYQESTIIGSGFANLSTSGSGTFVYTDAARLSSFITGGMITLPNGVTPGVPLPVRVSGQILDSDHRFQGSSFVDYRFTFQTVAVPEVATWAMMICGFGLIGTAMRRRGGSLQAHAV